jgi:hypothetical protein
MAQTLKFGNGNFATKAGSTLCYDDQNGNFKPIPMDFTRASTATRVNKQGLIEVVKSNVPRIDYTDTSDGVLLLEKAATNLFPYSEDFENSDWTKNAGTTITNNYAISPDGSLNASRYLGTGASGLGDKFTLSITDYTISFWVKSNTSQNQFCALLGDSSELSGDLLVTTEWNRISHTFTASGLSNKTNGIFRDSNNNDIDILIYGAMLEQNSVASSYIPSQGSASTRVAETASGAGNSEVFNDSEGVLFADIAALTEIDTYRAISISSGSDNDRINIWYWNNGTFKIDLHSGANSQYDFDFNANMTLFNKIAFKYKQNDFCIFHNGFKIGIDTSGITPVGLSELSFDRANGAFPFYGKTKEIGYYDTALTDLELETLTSYRTWISMVNELNLNIIYNG